MSRVEPRHFILENFLSGGAGSGGGGSKNVEVRRKAIGYLVTFYYIHHLHRYLYTVVLCKAKCWPFKILYYMFLLGPIYIYYHICPHVAK